MTDRINGFWVALERDTRIDDAEPLLAAVRQLRGVIGVDPHVVTPEDYFARTRVHCEISKALWDALEAQRKPQT